MTLLCRDAELEHLRAYLANPYYTAPLYLYGATATGKTSALVSTLMQLDMRFGLFDVALELSDEATFFQTILHGMAGGRFSHVVTWPLFIAELQSLLVRFRGSRLAVVLDNFHMINERCPWQAARFSSRFLTCLWRLNELLDSPYGGQLALVLVGQPSWSSLRITEAATAPMCVFFAPYDLAASTQIILHHYQIQVPEERHLQPLQATLVALLWQESRHRCIRALSDLYRLFSIYWPVYSEPIRSGSLAAEAHHVADTLAARMLRVVPSSKKRLSLFAPRFFDPLYLGQCNTIAETEALANSATRTLDHLPVFSKLLLVACYLASHISSTMDSRHFVFEASERGGAPTSSTSSTSVRKRRRPAAAGSSSTSAPSNELSGPLVFSTERMLEICRHLLQDMNVALTLDPAAIHEQIATLIKLNYLIRISSYQNITAPKLRVNISRSEALELATTIDPAELGSAALASSRLNRLDLLSYLQG